MWTREPIHHARDRYQTASPIGDHYTNQAVDKYTATMSLCHNDVKCLWVVWYDMSPPAGILLSQMSQCYKSLLDWTWQCAQIALRTHCISVDRHNIKWWYYH